MCGVCSVPGCSCKPGRAEASSMMELRRSCSSACRSRCLPEPPPTGRVPHGVRSVTAWTDVCVYVERRLSEVYQLFPQDPVMPSQEPPSDAQSEEVDPPADDTEDADQSETQHHNRHTSDEKPLNFTCSGRKEAGAQRFHRENSRAFSISAVYG